MVVLYSDMLCYIMLYYDPFKSLSLTLSNSMPFSAIQYSLLLFFLCYHALSLYFFNLYSILSQCLHYSVFYALPIRCRPHSFLSPLYSTSFYSNLFYSILFFILFYSILFYSILIYILFYSIILYSIF